MEAYRGLNSNSNCTVPGGLLIPAEHGSQKRVGIITVGMLICQYEHLAKSSYSLTEQLPSCYTTPDIL